MIIWTKASLAVTAAASLFAASAATAQQISLQDSFRLGSGAGVLCSAQTRSADAALKDMFDRAYAIVCRDAAVAVGQIYALRERGEDPAARLAALRSEKAECRPAERGNIENLGQVQVMACTLKDLNVDYRVYMWRARNTLYVAEGLTGYDSALQLGLRTIVADKPVEGEISIATTEAGDAASFARVQAGSLDPARALAEAYRRNNSGSYAEAAEFFSVLLASDPSGTNQAEALVNQALQQSNLGRFDEANVLFAKAGRLSAGDPVITRMLRNYRAMHLLNQQRPEAALTELNSALATGVGDGLSKRTALVIDAETATRLNSESPVSRQLSAASAGLSADDKAQILDGQAEHLRGTISRLQNRPDQATTALNRALAIFAGVRGGRVTSTVWMRAQILGELASIAEARGALAEAARQHQASVALLATDYPGSTALLNAQAQLAAFYARTGQTEPALTLYRHIVDANAESGNSSPTLRRTLAPYFQLLAKQASRPEAVTDMFKASQVLVRPGVAQTQAVLARELSGGSDEASRLFRQSVNLTRDIERTRIEVGRLNSVSERSAADAARLTALSTQLEQMQKDQVATQAKLAQFPRYRVLSGGSMTLSELQQVLRENEAYYKMTMVGDDGYAIYVTPTSARAFSLGADASEFERQVDGLRDTIAKVEDGQLLTYAFDVELAHKLYGNLFEPIESELTSIRHLIFEPDGAMLRLPPNLLVTDRAGVDAYLAKAKRPGDDGFDFTDVNWLGRDRDVSTAVSARSFRDVRQVAPSKADNDYIGFGQNEPAAGFLSPPSGVRGAAAMSDTCTWSLAEWGRPISAEELYAASRTIQGRGGDDTQIVTGQEFTDTAIKGRKDLDEYRIMHFATHGLVTAPRPECPARPALMTSFGEEGSDGLLSFSEIYDLRIDADLVILSACDTAGKASEAATREAGVTTGGDFALDGLVRAFVGAGGRSVIASHWPVPDDFNATQRLISGLFKAPAGTSTATALRAAQADLMNNADTSHPYYWSGFAIIGDGASPVMREAGRNAAGQK
jgi:CHAT domain-containing protein